MFPEIRDCGFEVELFDLSKKVFELQYIKIEDMKVTKSSDLDGNVILEELPSNSPAWWRKVEMGTS